MMTDTLWMDLVTQIANGNADDKEFQSMAADYLWDGRNWNRLKETAHGKFLRECGHVNKCPDPTLWAIYRKQVLGEK